MSGPAQRPWGRTEPALELRNKAGLWAAGELCVYWGVCRPRVLWNLRWAPWRAGAGDTALSPTSAP